MSSNTNFVQLKLSLAATAAQTTLTVMVPSAPFQLPAANGTLTLLDVPAAPTKAEIVGYTTVTDNGDGTATLGGVTRGKEGTTAQAWAADSFLFQSLTAADYAADLAGKQATITGGASTIASANLTASRALVSDSNGKVAESAVTAAELGYLSGVTSGVQSQLDAKLPLAGGTLTGTLIGRRIAAVGNGNDYASGAYEALGNGSANTVFPTIGFHQPTAYAASLQLRGPTDFRFYAQGAGSYANVTAANFNGSLNGNASTATTLAGNQLNWADYRSNAVANMLGWNMYGNGHVIFDASAGTSPSGTAVNNTWPDADWVPTYPTLMGWNGGNTFGVRVARAAQAEKCMDTGWVNLSLYNGFSHGNTALAIRRVGNIVYLQGQIYRATPPSALTEFATIPFWYRPAKSVSFIAAMQADNFNWTGADIGVGTNGSMAVGQIGVPTQNNAYWTINTSWVTEDA